MMTPQQKRKNDMVWGACVLGGLGLVCLGVSNRNRETQNVIQGAEYHAASPCAKSCSITCKTKDACCNVVNNQCVTCECASEPTSCQVGGRDASSCSIGVGTGVGAE